MPQNEARAWWADVQHVRESIERRRDGVADSIVPADPEPSRRFARTADAEPPVPRLDELDWPADLPSSPGRRFERSSGSQGSDRAVARARRHRGETERPHARSHRAAEAHTRTATSVAADESAGATGATSELLDFVSDQTLAPPPPPGVRRTVQITGRAGSAPSLPRLVEVERRRPGRRPAERLGPHPDRIALYAVLLGFFLILVAATSAHAAI